MSRKDGLARDERANSRFESILDPPETDWVWPRVELGRECRPAYFTQEIFGKRVWTKLRMASSDEQTSSARLAETVIGGRRREG